MTLVVNAIRYSRNAAILAAFFVLAVLVGCSSELEIRKLSGRTMGTSWSVVIANPIASYDQDALQTEIETVLLEVNRQMSTYDNLFDSAYTAQINNLFTSGPASQLTNSTTATSFNANAT